MGDSEMGGNKKTGGGGVKSETGTSVGEKDEEKTWGTQHGEHRGSQEGLKLLSGELWWPDHREICSKEVEKIYKKKTN